MPALLNPPTTKVDPLILQKLAAFAGRRRQLIVRRGLYAAVATLVVAMMIVAFLDWLFVLPDVVRWSLSGAAYMAILWVEWRSCWRLLLHAPGPREMARLFEHTEPKLREDLLSAVELGGEGNTEMWDSEEFRGLVQSNVAARVEKLDVEELLPARLLRRYTLVAIAVAVACVVAFAFTGRQLGTLMMRALLPMANFARVSKVKVHIVEPSPAEMRVAQGDTLPLIIEISGQSANKATLETFTPSGGREVVPMTPLARDRFSATIQVGRENVLYRVRAGDALTRKYQLEAVARPAVVEFTKAYTYPAYTRLAPKTVIEENGDLAALEGSQVQLRLRTNQKVRDAELRLELGKKSSVVPLTIEGDSLTAKLLLDASGIYRVRLIGAESGFENKFSPEYEVRAEPDLVPQVELESPKQDVILPSNEIVDVAGSASDDFALAKVAQWVKINDGPWKETVLATDPGAKAKVERRWDLFDQGVKPGDLLTTKLVATDLKGNRAESRPLQVTISAAGFETKRLQALTAYRQLYELLRTEQVAATALFKRGNDVREQFMRLADGDAQRIEVLKPLSAGVEDLAQKHAETMKQLSTTLHAAAPGHATGDLDLLGRALGREDRDGIQNARHLLEVLGNNPNLQASKDIFVENYNALTRADVITRQTVECCRSLLSLEQIDVLTENLQVVSLEQERLLSLAHHSGTDAEKWTPVANRLRVVLAELRGLEELAGAASDRDAHGIADRMRNLQKLLNKRRVALETGLAAKPGAELLGPTMELSQAVNDGWHQALDMGRDFRGRTVEVLRSLSHEAETSYMAFEQLRQDNQRWARNQRLPMEVSGALMDARWASHLDGWKTRGDVEEWRPDSDSFFVGDVRLTTRILQVFHQQGEHPETWIKDLQSIDQNFRVLECGHMLNDLVTASTELGAEERWELYNPKSRTMSPHDWAWLNERVRFMPDELIRALTTEERRGLAQAAQKILREIPNQEFSHALQREMDERFNPGREPMSRRDEADQLTAWLKQALELFREPMEEARKNLAHLAPTLSDAMKNLAKKTDDLRDKTMNQAQQAHEKLPDEAKADARQAAAEQQRLNQQIDALKDALRADANQQNVFDKEGRERARDADDAVAMLREPPQRAQEDLDLAAKSDKTATEEQALNQAAEQQEKLSQALQQMAEHYAAMDQGKQQETRAAMRATEQKNGVKDQLDQDFAKMEQMAKMAQSTPEEMLAQLEKALPQNPNMQKELSGISQNVLKGAAEHLKQASAQENRVAEDVQKLAASERQQDPAAQQNNPAAGTPAAQGANPAAPNQPAPAAQPAAAAGQSNPQQTANGQPPQSPSNAANANQSPPVNPVLAESVQQQTPIAKTAAQVADEVMRAGRHETRLDNKVAGQQLQQLGAQVEVNAQQQVPDARQALQQAQQAMQAQKAVNNANDGLKKSLEQLNAVANPAQAAPEQPGQPSPPEQANASAQAAPAAGRSMPAPAAAGQGAPKAASAANSRTAQNGQMPPAAGQGPPPTAAEALAPESDSIPTGPASPQEQLWMARTLDALDAALHAQAQGDEAQQAAQGGMQQANAAGKQQENGNAQASGQKSDSPQTSAAKNAGSKPVPQSAMAQAQSAMQKAAANAARAARDEAGSPDQPGQPQQAGMQAKSQGGMQSPDGGTRGALGEAKNKPGDWGKLPKQMAEQLTQGQQEGIAGEYRNQVETYYRVIAEKSKKQ